jgi:hypothetical protein
VEVGSVTFKAAAQATAASAAFPPLERISIPAAVAKGCDVETIPRRPWMGERREEKLGWVMAFLVKSCQLESENDCYLRNAKIIIIS